MDTFSLLCYFLLFLVTYFIIKHIIVPTRLNYKLPPSPFLCFPIIGHLYLFKKPLHRSLARVADQYGPILYLRFGVRPVLLLSSHTSVEECLIRNNVFVDRPKLIPGKYAGYNYTNIAWAPYGPHWRNQRRIATVEILSSQSLHNATLVRADVIRSFVKRMLSDITSQKGVVEMKSILFSLTLDNMMRVLVGRSSFENKGGNYEETDAAKRFQEITKEGFRLSGASNKEDFLPILKLFRVFWGSLDKIMQKLNDEKDEFMAKFMKEHRMHEKEGSLTDWRKKSMLHALLSLQKDDPKYYDDQMITMQILTLFLGGTDTAASTTVWALSLLLNHPEVLIKAQSEIDTKIGRNRLVEESDREELPYIQCIINETLRMCPPGPLSIPYESRGDCKIGGYYVPKGTMLLYNIWAIHNDPNIWDEPDKFNPERFMGVDVNKLGYKFIPFGVGKRICPGEQFARRFVWHTIAALIQCFDWERIGDGLVDMKEGGGLTLAKLEPLLVKCRPRSCMENVLSQL